MFPPKCSQPLCRNMLVTIDGTLKYAGTAPNCIRNSRSSRSLICHSYRNASVLRAMMPIVTYGVVRDGMTSLTGNIRGQYSVQLRGTFGHGRLCRPYIIDPGGTFTEASGASAIAVSAAARTRPVHHCRGTVAAGAP